MSEKQIKRTGFTKLGFTKAGFGCCSHFNHCEMGKSNCFYEARDPEVQNYCAAFLRNQKNKQKSIVKSSVAEKTPEKVELELSQDEEGQLSLF